MAPQKYSCLLCGIPYEAAARFPELPRVTSDSKPFKPGGEIGACSRCGMVQKPETAALLRDIAEIYRDYAMFAQSSALSEQAVFNDIGNAEICRSSVVVKCVGEHLALKETGAYLDVGCGTGPFLSAFAEVMPGWFLHAQDLDNRYEERLRRFASFKKLYVGEIDAIQDRFDVISLSHSLEHFMQPVQALKTLSALLNRNGALVIQVPDLMENVFDLAVCDHRSHFTANSLGMAAKAAGFPGNGIMVLRGVVPKQLTMVLSHAALSKRAEIDPPVLLAYDLQQGISALFGYAEAYRDFIKDHETIAVFGVATAATWFASIDSSPIAYFVDEDKSRAGSSHLGIPVVSPNELPKHIPVFVGMAPASAERNVCARLSAFGFTSLGSTAKERAA